MMGTFFAVAALVSWAPLALLGPDGFDSQLGRAVSIFYSFGPLLAALIVQGPMLKAPVLEPLGIGRDVNRFWLIAWLAPVLVLAVGLVATWLIDGVTPTLTVDGLIANKRSMVPAEHIAEFEARLREGRPPHPIVLVFIALPAGLTFNMIPAFAEEVGLRGFLFREVPGDYTKRAIGIGFLSYLWALPALALGLWYREHVAVGLVVGLCLHLSLSLATVYIRVRSGSVIACALFRGTVASLVPVALDLSFGARDITRPMYGLAGTIGLLVLVGLFLVHDRFYADKKLVFRSAVTPERRSSPPAGA
jgi:hypothetical protein